MTAISYKTTLIALFGFSSLWSPVLVAEVSVKQILEACPAIEGANIVGMATNSKSQQLVYCEYHFLFDESAKVSTVVYMDTKAERFAEKRLSYVLGAYLPNLYQEDFRHGDVRVVTLSDDQSWWRTSHQKANGGRLKETSLDADAKNDSYPVVIDAGVNAFILDNASLLLSGEHQRVHFLSPIHGRFLQLKLRKSSAKTCGGISFDKNNSHCILVEPQNIFLRWLVDPIALVYDQDLSNLQVYSGIVNITDDNGKDLTATIHYHYP